MNNRPVATITLILMSIAVTIAAPAFDSSFYGFNGHPAEWLSFSPEAPFRHMGMGLIFSPFLHIHFWHLVTNIVVLIPVALMMERKKSGLYLVLEFIAIHLQVLIMLVLLHSVFPMEGKAFVGNSHVVAGLYTFWSLNRKKFRLLILPLSVIAIGLWDSNSLSLIAHILGCLAGIVLYLLTVFGTKLALRARIDPS